MFRRDSPHYWERDRSAWGRFVQYRATLAGRLQEHWLSAVRAWRPDLDLALTHIDDRFDTRMRESLGADAAALLPLAERLDFTFVIEDPATVWHLGPERYPEIARHYAALTPLAGRLAVDLNIVERYQNVYPTKKQTGTELFQLLHLANGSFARVMLYFEQSIARADYELLSAASAAVSRMERAGDGWRVEALQTAGVRWKGAAKVDGRSWPVTDGETVWIPPGQHLVERDPTPAPVRLLQLNADLLDARVVENGVEFDYRSSSRAAALVDRRPVRILLDGRPVEAAVLEADHHFTVLLPRGRRTARILSGEGW